MSENEIIEGNKIIAEFMGKSIYPEKISAKNKRGFKWSYPWKGEYCDFSKSEIKYHSSWDWLMPVVEKIEELRYDVDINKKDGNRKINSCTIWISISNWDDITNESKSKIESVWKTIVDFIKWHKHQKEKMESQSFNHPLPSIETNNK